MKLVLIFIFCTPFLLFSQSEQIIVSDTIPNSDTLSIQKDTSNIIEFISYQEASFPGGSSEFNNYIEENIRYPEWKEEMNEFGRIFIEFMVNADGSIEDVKVLKGIVKELDEELVRLIENMPNWIPADSAQGKVRSLVRLPFNFKPY